MAENEIQKMLKTVMIMQTEILGRLENLERHFEVDQGKQHRCRHEALGAMYYIAARSDTAKELWEELRPIANEIDRLPEL